MKPRGAPVVEIAERFWRRVQRADGCWEWQGKARNRGYGVMRVGGQQQPAHRIAWALVNGAIPDGLFVLHTCDNRLCVRPDHLYLGTVQDNVRDRDERVRLCHGERHLSAKLTTASVQQIRARFAHGGVSKAELAREYGVTPAAVRYVIAGQTWRRVA